MRVRAVPVRATLRIRAERNDLLHTVFIVLHATAGVLAFGPGMTALRRPSWFGPFLAALVAMAVFLAAAVVRVWPGLD